ncbi:MAG: hypothetical protein ABI718_16130, partial [Acidobacteriota bacterium]
MSNEKLQDIPAAFPALTFVSGLLAAGIACGPLPSAAGFASIAILLAVLQIRSARIPVCLLSCAAGLYVGGIDAIRKAGDEAFIRAHEARFVVVKAPLNRGWGRREDGQWIMRTASFEVTEDQKISRRFRSPLTIYMASSPQSIGSEHSLLAEGLLKSSAHGSFILIVKSPLLLGYAGQVPAWNPALWNRTAAAGLDAYARAHP